MKLEEVLAGIHTHRARLHEQNAWDDPNALSDIGNKLATYNAYLADFLAPAHKQATDAAHAVYLEMIGKGESATKADTMARGETTNSRAYYEKIKSTYSATASLVSFIQTKIRVAENQMKQEGNLT